MGMQYKKLSISNMFPSLKTEQNDEKNKLRSVRPSQFLNILDLLPILNQKNAQQQKEIMEQRRSVLKEQKNFFLPSIAVPQPESNSPKKSLAHSLQLLGKNPQFQEQEQQSQKIKRHVGFKNSIRIIDYTNDIVSRDSINGEQKPLQRIRHRKTKTEADY